MRLKSILASLVMVFALGACESMSEFGGKMKSMAGMDDSNKYVVYFKSNSTNLTEESEGTLFDVMQAIRAEKVKKVRIVAYTDNKGNARYNQQLSMRRANSVKDRLESSGAKSIDIAGAGMAKPNEAPHKARRAEIFFEK